MTGIDRRKVGKGEQWSTEKIKSAVKKNKKSDREVDEWPDMGTATEKYVLRVQEYQRGNGGRGEGDKVSGNVSNSENIKRRSNG
jgi:hypothetical protein